MKTSITKTNPATSFGGKTHLRLPFAFGEHFLHPRHPCHRAFTFCSRDLQDFTKAFGSESCCCLSWKRSFKASQIQQAVRRGTTLFASDIFGGCHLRIYPEFRASVRLTIQVITTEGLPLSIFIALLKQLSAAFGPILPRTTGQEKGPVRVSPGTRHT